MKYQEVLRYFEVLERQGQTARCRCPVHNDKNPSLFITQGKDGKTLVHCQAGCETEDVLKAVGLSEKDLFEDDPPSENKEPWIGYVEGKTGKTVVERYDYYSVSGRYAYTKIRLLDKNGEKTFVFGMMSDDGRFHFGLNGNSSKGAVYGDLYGLQKAITEGHVVYVVEGEKDVNTMTSKRLVAITYGAAENWDSGLASLFREAKVCIIADNDDPGKKVALQIKGDLSGIAKETKIVLPMPDVEHGDVSDYFAEGHTVEEFEKMVSEQAGPAIEASSDTGKEEKDSKLETKKLEIITSRELDQMDLKPVEMIVDGLIPVGLSIIVAPPKYGKSWMMLQLCLDVAEGNDFLGYKTNRCGVLYLPLEDGYARLKERQAKILNGKAAPVDFMMATEAEDLENGLLDQLEEILKEYPKIKLIVIDTFQKVRGDSKRGENAYASDYKEMAEIKKFADEHHIAIILIHHTRKMQDPTDPFANISGTNGISGAADTMIVLSRENRDDKTTRMSITGRDVEEADLQIKFNQVSHQWELIGTAAQYTAQLEKESYEKDPIVKTIKQLLQEQGEWKGKASQLISDGRKRGFFISESSEKIGRSLTQLGSQLYEYDRIVYEPVQNGTGGKQHHFYYEASAPQPRFDEKESMCYQEGIERLDKDGELLDEEKLLSSLYEEEGYTSIPDDCNV